MPMNLTHSRVSSGAGFTSEEIQMLFRPFKDSDMALQQRLFGGTGIGLVLVENLVKRMDGNLDVQSHKGSGSSISFQIPMEIFKETIEEASENDVFQNAVNMRVLLVEDNIILQNVASKILQHQGFRVTIAFNGLEALNKYNLHDPFDIVLT